MALQEKEDVFSSNFIPVAPSLHSFWTVFQESYWLLAKFWGQMSNSFWIGIAVASLTLAIGTLTSFTIGRLRIRQGWMLTNAALMTYVIPMSFLAIPFYGIMGKYGMTDNPLAVIAVEVTFATPYAIFIFQQYGASIPYELDEAARAMQLVAARMSLLRRGRLCRCRRALPCMANIAIILLLSSDGKLACRSVRKVPAAMRRRGT